MGGSAFLLVFGGIIGIGGGFLYLSLRHALPTDSRRGLVFGVLLLLITGSAVIEGNNPDFHRLGPPLLNVGNFAALFLLFGLLFVAIFDYLERSLPQPSSALRGLSSSCVQAVALVLTPFSIIVFWQVGSQHPALGAVLAYVLLVVPFTRWLLPAVRQAQRFQYALLAPAIATGLFLDLRALTAIFSAAG